jgi:hypothetical protein
MIYITVLMVKLDLTLFHHVSKKNQTLQNDTARYSKESLDSLKIESRPILFLLLCPHHAGAEGPNSRL